MAARIEDVARAAGVSTATVSRALRGLPNVSPHTRTVVFRAATDLGYVVSRAASSLASGRTGAIGVISPFMERWYFGQVIAAVEGELRRSGYDALLIGVSDPEDDLAKRFDIESLRSRVDAVVVLTLPLTGTQLDGLRRLAMPTVFVGASVDGHMSVRIDDMAVARLATDHLLSLGHRKVAFVGGNPHQTPHFAASIDRRAGWLATMRAAGHEPPPDYDEAGGFTAEGGREAAQRLLDLDDPPTAIFAASDEMAFGVIAAARDRRVRVPGQLSVVGVDGHELGSLVDLTTVEQPIAEQGARAARMLLAALAGEQRRRNENVVLPVALHVCGTTAAPP